MPIGLAHLAQNSVPVTYAGQVERQIILPTSLVATDASLEGTDTSQHFNNMAARLTFQDGQAVVGATIDFVVGQITVCTETTGAGGVATCSAAASYASGTVPSSYTASFGGLGPFQASSPASAGLSSNVTYAPAPDTSGTTAPTGQ